MRRFSATTATFVGGLYEKAVSPTATEERHYIGGSVLVTITGRTASVAGTTKTRYLHKDHLGSITAITDEGGAEVEAFSFDPWGKRRAPTLASLIAKIGSPWTSMSTYQKSNLTLVASALSSTLTNKGFTGHEQLDGVELIHMGGRVYDAEIGRFLSADPFEQDITNLQGAYKKNKHPFHPGPAATLTANDPPGKRSIAPHGPEFHSRRCKHAPFFSTVGSIPTIRHDKSLPRRCERSI